nr:IS4/IS5 family transposase [Lachnospiraceae bacterium]
ICRIVRKIKPEAFQALFYLFSKSIPSEKNFHGYQLVACDGTRLNLPYNPADSDTFVDNIEGRKGFNQVHMNALYDILNDLFLDVEMQGMHEMNERGAFCKFLDKHSEDMQKTIFIADRGYHILIEHSLIK